MGFLLTEDGNYDMNNKKKLANIKDGSNNDDALNEKQITDLILANGGSGYLKLDGSSTMKGHLLMDFNRVQDIGNPRQNKADAVPYAYLNNFFFKCDDDNNKLDCQSTIEMQNKK